MLQMGSRNFSITIPADLAELAEKLANIRNAQPGSGKWSKNYIIRLALEEYLERSKSELEQGGRKKAQ